MNEVEKSLMRLNQQVEEYNIRYDTYVEAYNKFQKCEEILEEEIFVFINNILRKAIDFYEDKLNGSIEARKEIMDKFNIVYFKEVE